MQNLSGNLVSNVWVEGDAVFKRSPKYMIDNEVYALETLKDTGFVPRFEQLGDELIKMELLVREHVPYISADHVRHMEHLAEQFLDALKEVKIRHGDLTYPHLFFIRGTIKVIDWGESRMWDDPRPDKRREGDRHWIYRTIRGTASAYQCTQ